MTGNQIKNLTDATYRHLRNAMVVMHIDTRPERLAWILRRAELLKENKLYRGAEGE